MIIGWMRYRRALTLVCLQADRPSPTMWERGYLCSNLLVVCLLSHSMGEDRLAVVVFEAADQVRAPGATPAPVPACSYSSLAQRNPIVTFRAETTSQFRPDEYKAVPNESSS